MRPLKFTKRILLILLATFIFAAPVLADPADLGRRPDSRPDRFPIVGAATYNAYIGTDVFAVLNGDRSLDQAIADIVAANFPERAQAIVEALVKSAPDLIGIQEAWHILVNTPQLQLDWNYKEILADLLKHYGYREVVSSDLSDIMIPVDPANPAYYVRVTDHDVIFANKRLKVSEVESLLYDHTFKAPLAGQMIVSKRGLVSAVFTIHDQDYRFVNTHLETQDLPAVSTTGEVLGVAQDLQAGELMDHLSGESRPVILAGDFNAQPQDMPVAVIEDGGFTDMWSLRIFGRRNAGFTCCQSPDLLNAQSILDQRIDHIFVRNENGDDGINVAFPMTIRTIGDRIAAKTESDPRLWPSDHAGLSASLIIPALDKRDDE